jgi:predicted PurR-regulated permease PerM
MNLSLNKLLQWLVLALLFPLVFLNGWLAVQVIQYFQPLVTIFVLATLLAFILNYPVSFLQQYGVKRNYAVILVFLPTLVILVALAITLVPFLLEEFNEIAKLLPQWIDSGSQQLQAFHNWAISQNLPINLSQILIQIKDRLPDEVEYFGDKIFSLALNTIDSISEAVLTVVLTFYILLDAERLWNGIFQKLPSSFGPQVQQSLQQNFQNYFIGQIALASVMGLSMTVMFLVLKVPFGLVFGLVVGIMSLIPFGDVLSLGVIILLVTSHNFWLGVKVLGLATLIDQVIDQAIAPRLLGSFTGLRPLWVLVSLIVGTNVGGLLGLLLAVPVASVIKSAADGWQVSTTSSTSNVKDTTQSNSSEQAQGAPGILTKESTSQSTNTT